MSSGKPFKSDLATWAIGYVKEQVALYGVTAEIYVNRDCYNVPIEYLLFYRISKEDVKIIASLTYKPYDLVEMYHAETLDMIAHRFAHWVRRKIEEMGNG